MVNGLIQRSCASQMDEGPSRPLHVLVVDDQPLVCATIELYLIHDGHTVETAANGLEGLRKFHAGRFDLVVVDKSMPEMSGDQLITIIKQRTPNKPVILLTGSDATMSSEHSPGPDIILKKPVDQKTFRQALAKAHRSTYAPR